MNLEFDEVVERDGLNALYNFFPHIAPKDLSQVDFVHDKRDGSLISSYMHEGAVRLKSKTALASEQALGAMRVLNSDPEYYAMVESYVKSDHTVNFEYTAPDNRIVLPYQVPELKILGIRCNHTGEYKNYTKLYHMYPQWMVDDHTSLIGDSAEAFIAGIPDMKGIEGFVIGLTSGQRIKIKTNEYLSLHRAKDSVYSNKRLFEVCLNEASDDLRTLFHDDPYVLNRITEMENIVAPAYNHMVSCVEAYYEANKDLSQKDYAIKGQQELDRLHFNLAMSKFHGKEVHYKDSMMKNFKLFVKDEELKPE